MGQSVGTAKTAAQLVLDGRARRSDAVIAGLAALSGACGLAYEILYIRIFTNYFGDSFILTGVTLSAVFLGLAFGAWMSGRFLRWLGLIEITIGLYAFATAWGLSTWGFEIAAWGGTPALNSVKLGMLLGTPAFLIGTCVPLFAAYARGAGPDTPPAFTRIYGLYNFGAFLSVLAIEFVLFRSFGLKATLSIIGTGRCRPDIVYETPDGKIGIIEVKTGNAEFTIRQSEIYPQIKDGNAIPRGKVADDFGLEPGVPLKDQGYPNGIPIEIRTFPGVGQ